MGAGMCSLILALQQVPGFPVAVAANRDEALDRPSEGPLRWSGTPAFVAPRDLQAGGTWLGVARSGLFVGVTNRYKAKRDPARESRGELVVEALRFETAPALHAHLASLAPRRFNAFHLAYADMESAYVTWSDGNKLTQLALGPGLHMICERSYGGGDEARQWRVKSEWSARRNRGTEPEEWRSLLTQHATLNPFDATCVHASMFNYGTRSSALYFRSPNPALSRFYFADGKPCETPFKSYTNLLDGLA
jgi:hypothetical protein